MSWTTNEIKIKIGHILGKDFQYRTTIWKSQITIDVENTDIRFADLEALSNIFNTKNINYGHKSNQMGSDLTGPYGGECQITINDVDIKDNS